MPFEEAANTARIEELRHRGVEVWGPERVYVDESVRLDAIEPGAVIRQASLSGSRLSVATGAEIGTSGHAEVQDCQIGPGVQLGSGLYRGATMLEGVQIRGFAEIRPDTLLEEQADLAHTVALKNTTFTACCVAGSLINFCDLFLSGGSSRKDHTEVGSGAIHYNFDPRGDKWGSLIGGIRGVLMRSAPVFIGGHCGIVGPVEIGLGAVTAAGSTIRRNVPEGKLFGTPGAAIPLMDFNPKEHGAMTGPFRITAKFVATLRALDAWYSVVRIPHARGGEAALYEAARLRIRAQVAERIERLDRVVKKLQDGGAGSPAGQARTRGLRDHDRLVGNWPDLRSVLERPGRPAPPPASFLQAYSSARREGKSHLDAIRQPDPLVYGAERWLDGQVRDTMGRAVDALGG